MSDHAINNMIDTTMEKIKELVDVNTIIGEAINLENGISIIPVSKVSYGFGTGGSEFSGKKTNADNLFGGGSGAGVTISPIAFLTVSKEGHVKILHAEPIASTTDKVIDMVPEVVDKISSVFKKSDNDKISSDDICKK